MWERSSREKEPPYKQARLAPTAEPLYRRKAKNAAHRLPVPIVFARGAVFLLEVKELGSLGGRAARARCNQAKSIENAFQGRDEFGHFPRPNGDRVRRSPYAARERGELEVAERMLPVKAPLSKGSRLRSSLRGLFERLYDSKM